jgi:hypothetical protein
VSRGLISLARSLTVNVLGSWLVYAVAERLFPSPSMVPLWASVVVPTADLIWELWKRRAVDAVAVITLSQLAASILISLFAGTPHGALVGHAFQAAALGLVFAASIALGRPLMVPLARQAMAGDDPVRRGKFDQALAELPGLRRRLALMSLVWAVALCAETGVRLVILQHAEPATYLLIAGILGWAVPSVLAVGSIRYGRWIASRMRSQASLDASRAAA